MRFSIKVVQLFAYSGELAAQGLIRASLLTVLRLNCFERFCHCVGVGRWADVRALWAGGRWRGPRRRSRCVLATAIEGCDHRQNNEQTADHPLDTITAHSKPPDRAHQTGVEKSGRRG